MLSYILRRFLLIFPTLWVIITLNFIIIQFVPGGPVDQLISQLTNPGGGVTERFGGFSSETGERDQGSGKTTINHTETSKSLDPDLILYINKLYGFDKPLIQRYGDLIYNYLRFDLGESYFREISVINLVIEKLPVSMSLGLWSTLIVYGVSLPLGIRKALRHRSRFDRVTSTIIIAASAIPTFLLAIILIILFCGGEYSQLFPLRGLFSDNFSQLSFTGKILDYLWHIVLPTISMSVPGFATLTLLTKNSFLDEINKPYVLTARAKGLTEKQILYNHVFRNAMLIIISGFPLTFMGMIFAGSLLIEIIFSLDGLGLLGYSAIVMRDYPVVLGTLYIFTLIGLIMNIVSDILYMIIDKRITFDASG